VFLITISPNFANTSQNDVEAGDLANAGLEPIPFRV
jgi:hypothetical protein